MNKIIHLYAAFLAFLIISCGSAPQTMPSEGNPMQAPLRGRPQRQVPEKPEVSVLEPERAIPEIPEKIQALPPEHIMGKGRVPLNKLTDFLLKNNPLAESDFVKNLAVFYIEEAAAEGVNYDVAFTQMCLETGFLSYGGLVTPDMNNFCGLGSTGLPGPDGPERGLIFPDPRTGARAHIQHLKGYATEEPLNQELVDPRYRWVRLGAAPTIYGLAGTWAADREYGNKLSSIMQRLYNFSFQ